MAKTDLEKFVSAAGRDAQIKEVRKRIDELGIEYLYICLLYTSPSPRDATLSRMPSSA